MRYFFACGLLLLISGWASNARALTIYRITPLGFDDLEHTRSDGHRENIAAELNDAGQVRGNSKRFGGGSTDLGQSAWLYDGSSTVNVGLVDSEYTQSDGYRFSESQQLNAAGQVRGYSNRYDGGSDLGRSAWLYDGTATVRIGFSDVEHTRDDGYQYSSADQLDQLGHVIGYSLRYDGGNADLGRSAWIYDGASTVNIGLVGSEHTRSDGYKYSSAADMNAAGQVRGTSQRYGGGSASIGSSAWTYNGSSTVEIGLVDADHTRSDGIRLSFTDEMNQAGQVLGWSVQYVNGTSTFGISPWLYDGNSTVRVGLTGGVHTRADGLRSSSAIELNEAGNVFGHSLRYIDGLGYAGSDAWLYTGSTTVQIGLFGSGYVRSDGYARTVADEMNEAGQVRGFTERFDGNRSLGYSAWLNDGTATVEIGLTDSEHTTSTGSSTGFRNSITDALNAAGQVIGRSGRFDGSDSAGQSAWLYNGTTTVKLGLVDSEHTSANGERNSEPLELNDTGKVRGTSFRYANDVSSGESAWLYDGTATIKIGLTGSEHTKNNGYKRSRTIAMNDAGQVTGSSERYDGGMKYLGSSAWLYNGQTAVEIGLTGGEQTRNDGYLFNHADRLNDAGQVLGYAERYIGGSSLMGRNAWFYDPTLDQTFDLQLSMRSDGYAYSSASYLGEDGLVLGLYSLFDAFDTDLGTRLFYFTVADGLHDLGALVQGGLSANGWDYLAWLIRVNGAGQILGSGRLSALAGEPNDYRPFLLTPVVPEPSATVLTLCGLGGVLLRRRRVEHCGAAQ